ncbi:hybrid sensor histidine kinase/response regulator [Kineococcus rhizosphaerae]|uniref:Circadian input-output histidine kinase CikA n=1 Tax=Kineococcus rhizosphaerae TaxID=559628 RepID=A0A2T0R4T9_9ACTN|nr:ATP-binding protein [Kineococcus rhizosphaerae]PRY15792.1 signal transduction histidine kinase [Kineococcus rhizosphaerae]
MTDTTLPSVGESSRWLAEYGLPEGAPAEQLRAVTRVAATVTGAASAVVNLLDDCFQHQVGEVGFSGGRSPVSDSMCAVSLRDERLRYLPDARLEPAFARNPWVDGRLASVGLYASAPLVLPDGRVLGSLCVFSEEAGTLGPAQLDALRDLAAQAVALFEHARLARERTEQAVRYRQARDEAERRGALTAAVTETLDAGVVACDADGHLTLFNPAARAFHGLLEDPTVATADWAGTYSLFHEDGTTPLAEQEIPLFRALVDGAVHDQTIVIAPAHREPLTVRCDGRAMRDSAGRLLGAVVAMTDVTQARAQARALAEARDEALAATRAKTAFLAAASHEIRTPLNGVLGMLEVLSLESLTERQHGHVQVARDAGNALLALLNDVLDLSKAETAAVVLAEEDFRPGDVADDVVTALGPIARRKGLELQVRTGAAETLVGDPRRLRQVLMNLVGNAIKFTDHGRVSLDVSGTPAGAGTTLRLAVADTGAGMSAEEQDRLFEPFTQGSAGERHGGTGLGLALSRQIVELMGGRIEVDSHPGRGSTFTVVVDLPRAVPSSAAPAVADDDTRSLPAPGGPVTGSRPRVLIADDNDINLMVAGGLFGAEGADVTTVGDGDAAVRAAADGAFDLVLLDLQMPGTSGLGAVAAIRALPGRAGRGRVLALTGDTLETTAAACRAAGMDGVLVKPVRGADVRRVLAELDREG